MKVQALVPQFTKGEISPRLDIRVDTEVYRGGAKTIENGIVMAHGGVRKRGGTKFIAELKDSTSSTVRLIPFEFNTEQAYMLEVGYGSGAGYIRPYKDQGAIVDSTKTITGITKANPGVVTCVGHGFSTGYQILLAAIGGMVELNNRRVTITVLTADTFSIGINTSSFTTYTSGGTASHPVNIATSYAANEIADLSTAQSADTLFIASETHKLGTLTRASHTSWTLANAAIKNGPFRPINSNPQNYMGVAATGFASISGATRANPVVITTSGAHGFEEGASISIAGVGGMTQLNGNRYIARNVTSTTFQLWTIAESTVNGTAYGAYTSGGTASIDKTTFGTIAPGSTVRLVSSSAVFESGHVGALFRLWEPGQAAGVKAFPVGDTTNGTLVDNLQFTEDSKVYGAINVTGTNKGSEFTRVPNHASGVVRVYGKTDAAFFDDVYLHDSSCTVEILTVLSSTIATARVKRNHVPRSVIDFNTNLWEEGAWSVKRGFPSVVGFHEGRLYAASSTSDQQTVWASRSQAFTDFQDGAKDDDALDYTAASGKIDRFRWMIPGKVLALGTSSSEYVAAASNQNEALTPSNVRMVPQTQFGSSQTVKPVKIGQSIIFGQRRGVSSNPSKKLRELVYEFASDNYVATDITIISEHITGNGVTELTYQADPDSVIWCVRDDGQIASLTYEDEQKVKGWHRQILGGSFGSGNAVVERVATIPGATTDEVWMIVKRTINGATKRYIEVLSPGYTTGDALTAATFLDSYLTYSGTATTAITGLSHLEGQTVYALADGTKQGPFTVSNGRITLTTAASTVHVGLKYTTVVESLDLEAGAKEGTAKSRAKHISQVWLDLNNARGGRVGPDSSNMYDIAYRGPTDLYAGAAGQYTGLQEFNFPAGWKREAIVRVEHDDPYPFTLLGFVTELNTSG